MFLSLLRGFVFLCASVAFASATNLAEKFVMSFVIENEDIANADVVNSIIGANSFYESGVYGQGVKVAVMESGSIWSEHTFFENAILGEEYTPDDIENSISVHKTACAGIIGGLGPEVDGNYYSVSFGIAPQVEICSGITGDGTYVYASAFYKSYKHFFETNQVDVVSTSESPIPEGEVSEPIYQSMVDAFASANSKTTFVAAAGNDGPAENTICHLALSYNGISVGAMGNANTFDKIADFSSRAPSDFYNPLTKEIVRSVRAGIDICAPGENIGVAYYNKDSSETDIVAIASGTSFSAPIVAGVVALLASTSKTLEADENAVANGWSANARDSRVVKAVLLNSADKPSDWDNGQHKEDVSFINSDDNGNMTIDTFKDVIVTTQSLDYVYGAGMLNADKALLQYINLSQKRMLDLNTVDLNSSVFYNLGELSQGEVLTATVAWMVQNSFSAEMTVESEANSDSSDSLLETEQSNIPDTEFLAFADLNLELWFADGETLSAVALSNSEYNNVEHLYLDIAQNGNYYLRVVFNDVIYGETQTETYAIAWDIVVPEPATFASLTGLLILFVVVFARLHRRD